MVHVAALLLSGGRVRLVDGDLPGGPIEPGESPEEALARTVPEAIHPRLLATHHDGSILRLLYLAEPGELADGVPLAEAFAGPLSPAANHAVQIALTGSHAISRPRVGAYGVIVQDGRILLCRLSPFEGSGGKWTLPGGGLEFGEHPEEGAAREVREETGLEVRIGELLEVQSEVHPAMTGPLHSLRFLYRAEPIGGTLTVEVGGTTDAVAWHTSAEVAALPLVPLARRGAELAFGL